MTDCPELVQVFKEIIQPRISHDVYTFDLTPRIVNIKDLSCENTTFGIYHRPYAPCPLPLFWLFWPYVSPPVEP